ncbi:hypothetical protein ACS0TY_024937 [Phlomoides rotata]
MLLAFCEQTTGKKFQGDASDQKMLEIEMTRYFCNICTLRSGWMRGSNLSGDPKLPE